MEALRLGADHQQIGMRLHGFSYNRLSGASLFDHFLDEHAQDIAQEKLIHLATQFREFPDASVLSAWLYEVANTQ